MQINRQHLVEGIAYHPSPNCNDRPDESDISLLVIHNISLPPGEFGGPDIDALFTNQLDCSSHPFYQQLQGLEVSAHLVIDRCGGMVQYVPFNRRAWHAGASCFAGRDNCNDYAIGIELEGTDEEAYTDAQYAQLSQLTKALMARYPTLSKTQILGHSDIAPGRKTDPGPAFDWQRYKQEL